LLVKQATAAPPPLPKLRQDVPRPLALAVHTLLAKRPEDRPRTAAAAKALLERSLIHPERTLPDIEPLSSMVAAASLGQGIAFRVGTPLVLVLMFGAFLAWGYTGQSAGPIMRQAAASSASASIPAQLLPATYRDEIPAPAVSDPAVVKETIKGGLTMQRARRIASNFSRGSLRAVQIVDTDSGQAIVAVNQPQAGKTNFFILEKRGSKYRVSSRGKLDIEGFRRATWTSEVVDVDEDGYEEVIFTGKDSQNRAKRHVVLHVPNDKRTYSMLLPGEVTVRGTPRIIWLANAAGADAAVYRTALRKKARELVGTGSMAKR
jgi:hypothetical protein